MAFSEDGGRGRKNEKMEREKKERERERDEKEIKEERGTRVWRGRRVQNQVENPIGIS